ncbi:hypothetical protein H6763_01795 [Candidatus Nomurabacteria bacterium]|nr:hypothetical protein [Candidatus Nomurabacteria bacterium]MCB9803540.1 hypothetical protein [Candidatus Nomurabacteria bacterium]
MAVENLNLNEVSGNAPDKREESYDLIVEKKDQHPHELVEKGLNRELFDIIEAHVAAQNTSVEANIEGGRVEQPVLDRYEAVVRGGVVNARVAESLPPANGAQAAKEKLKSTSEFILGKGYKSVADDMSGALLTEATNQNIQLTDAARAAYDMAVYMPRLIRPGALNPNRGDSNRIPADGYAQEFTETLRQHASVENIDLNEDALIELFIRSNPADFDPNNPEHKAILTRLSGQDTDPAAIKLLQEQFAANKEKINKTVAGDPAGDTRLIVHQYEINDTDTDEAKILKGAANAALTVLHNSGSAGRETRVKKIQHSINIVNAGKKFYEEAKAKKPLAEISENALNNLGQFNETIADRHPESRELRKTLTEAKDRTVEVEALASGPVGLKREIVGKMTELLSAEDKATVEALLEKERNGEGGVTLEKVIDRALVLSMKGDEASQAKMSELAHSYANVRFLEQYAKELGGDDPEKQAGYFAVLAASLLKEGDQPKENLKKLMFGLANGNTADIRLYVTDFDRIAALLPEGFDWDSVKAKMVQDENTDMTRMQQGNQPAIALRHLKTPSAKDASYINTIIPDFNKIRNWEIARHVYEQKEKAENTRLDELKAIARALGVPADKVDGAATRLLELLVPPAEDAENYRKGLVPFDKIIEAAATGAPVGDGYQRYVEEMRHQLLCAIEGTNPAEAAEVVRFENYEQLVDSVREQADEQNADKLAGEIDLNGKKVTSEEAMYYNANPEAFKKNFEEQSDGKWWKNMWTKFKSGGWKKLWKPAATIVLSGVAATAGGFVAAGATAVLLGMQAHRMWTGFGKAKQQFQAARDDSKGQGWKAIAKTMVPAVVGLAWGLGTQSAFEMIGYPAGALVTSAIELGGIYLWRKKGLKESQNIMRTQLEKYQKTFSDRVVAMTESEADKTFRAAIMDVLALTDAEREGLTNQQLNEKIIAFRKKAYEDHDQQKLRQLGGLVDNWMKHKDAEDTQTDADKKVYAMLLSENLRSKETLKQHYSQIATFTIFSGLGKTTRTIGRSVDKLFAATGTEAATGSAEAVSESAAPQSEMTVANVGDRLDSQFDSHFAQQGGGTLLGLQERQNGTVLALFDTDGNGTADMAVPVSGMTAAALHDGSADVSTAGLDFDHVAYLGHEMPSGTDYDEYLAGNQDFAHEFESMTGHSADSVTAFSVEVPAGAHSGPVGFIDVDRDGDFDYVAVMGEDGNIDYVESDSYFESMNGFVAIPGGGQIEYEAHPIVDSNGNVFVSLESEDGNVLSIVNPVDGSHLDSVTTLSGSTITLKDEFTFVVEGSSTSTVEVGEVAELQTHYDIDQDWNSDMADGVADHSTHWGSIKRIGVESGLSEGQANQFANDAVAEARGGGGLPPVFKGDSFDLKNLAPDTVEKYRGILNETGGSTVTDTTREIVTISRTSITVPMVATELTPVHESVSLSSLTSTATGFTVYNGALNDLPDIAAGEARPNAWERLVNWGNPREAMAGTDVKIDGAPESWTEENTVVHLVTSDGTEVEVPLSRMTDMATENGGVVVRYVTQDGEYATVSGFGASLEGPDGGIIGLADARITGATYTLTAGEVGQGGATEAVGYAGGVGGGATANNVVYANGVGSGAAAGSTTTVVGDAVQNAGTTTSTANVPGIDPETIYTPEGSTTATSEVFNDGNSMEVVDPWVGKDYTVTNPDIEFVQVNQPFSNSPTNIPAYMVEKVIRGQEVQLKDEFGGATIESNGDMEFIFSDGTDIDIPEDRNIFETIYDTVRGKAENVLEDVNDMRASINANQGIGGYIRREIQETSDDFGRLNADRLIYDAGPGQPDWILPEEIQEFRVETDDGIVTVPRHLVSSLTDGGLMRRGDESPLQGIVHGVWKGPNGETEMVYDIEGDLQADGALNSYPLTPEEAYKLYHDDSFVPSYDAEQIYRPTPVVPPVRQNAVPVQPNVAPVALGANFDPMNTINRDQMANVPV